MRIANTDLGELFPLALGTLYADRWEKESADKVFDAFIDAGGNVIDTARVYTDISGSEFIIGKWLKNSGKRSKAVIISKGGHPKLYPGCDMHNFRLGKDEMTCDLNESLAALGTDYIDIYLYHRDDPERSVEETVETMESFVKDGKIRYYGISNWTLPRIIEAQAYCEKKAYRGFVLNQSLINLGSEHGAMPADDTLVKIDENMQNYHKAIANTEHDILAAGFSSICGGFFHQYINGGEKLVRDRSYLTEGNIAIAEEIRKRTEKNNTTISYEVLSFYKQLDFPCMAIFGPRDSKGIVEAAAVWNK